MENTKVKHMVIFNLKHSKDSKETNKFLAEGKALLTTISNVENFCVHSQISPKNKFDYGFSMEFCDKSAFDAYANHPIHVDFVKQRWETEVTDFLEIDFADYK